MKPVEEIQSRGGYQHIYRFDNDFGASVINHSFSYGTELAVVKFNSKDNFDFEIKYNTPITDDVIGYLSEVELEDILKEIKGLK